MYNKGNGKQKYEKYPQIKITKYRTFNANNKMQSTFKADIEWPISTRFMN